VIKKSAKASRNQTTCRLKLYKTV